MKNQNTINNKQKNYFKFISLFFLLIWGNFSYALATPQLTFPITYKDIERYLDEFYIKSEYQDQTKAFNEQEVSIHIQCGFDDFGANEPINVNLRYFEAVRPFKIDGFTYKLIIYNRDDVGGDIEYLNVQLNSYDEKDNLVDALLLDSRFAYEGFEAFTEFNIGKSIISIDSYIVHFYTDEMEYGVDPPLDPPIHKLWAKYQYKIDNGKFKLISSVSGKQEKPNKEYSDTSLPITNVQFEHYYIRDKENYIFSLKSQYLTQAKNFTQQEANVFIKGKGLDFKLKNVTTDMRYIEVGSFELDSYTYKLIMYQYSDDGRIHHLNTQLNSYNKYGDLIDAFLLEDRFTDFYGHDYGELNNFFTFLAEFSINQNIIEVEKYAFAGYDLIESKDIPHSIEHPSYLGSVKERYKIVNGKFKPLHISYVEKNGQETESEILSLPFTQARTADYYVKNIPKESYNCGFSSEKSGYNGGEKLLSEEVIKYPFAKGKIFFYYDSDVIPNNARSIDVGWFETDDSDHIYRLIMYRFEDEIGNTILYTQLNSLDPRANYKINDALILERRFCNGVIEIFSKFTVNGDAINIDTYQAYNVEGLIDPVPELSAKEQYKIDNGKFRQVSSHKFNESY